MKQEQRETISKLSVELTYVVMLRISPKRTDDILIARCRTLYDATAVMANYSDTNVYIIEL